jgi:hypothetical protein
MTDKKRSSTGKYSDQATSAQGVGGRHKGSVVSIGGGGYLDVCNKTETDLQAADPRLDELREIGLSASLQRYARAVGFDAFMTLWQIIENDQRNRSRERGLVIQIPRLKTYQRFQRNRFIEALSSEGVNNSKIHLLIKEQFGEAISKRHIDRISKKSREGSET